MQFINASKQHLYQLMPWFNNQEDVYQWGGPGFRFPFSEKSICIDSKLDELHSYVILDDNEVVIAFGQYYQRLGCCHLGRLIVSPAHRGQGYGKILINNLIETGCLQLDANEASLFVLSDNRQALGVYESMGFRVSSYPANMPIADCVYMKKKLRE